MRYNPERHPRLYVIDEKGMNVEEQYLRYDHGALRLATRIMPSMLTLDKETVRQDCLCYFMERLGYERIQQ